MSASGNEDLIADYLGEAQDYLEQLNTTLMEIAEGDAAWPSDRVSELFRSAHSLKGLSACFGFDKTNTVTHHLESLLTMVRDGKLEPSTAIVRAMFDAIDVITDQTAQIASQGAEVAVPEGIIETLEAYCSGAGPVSKAPKVATKPAGEGRAATAAKKEPADGAKSASPKGGDSNETVRVRMERLDRMVNLTGELVVARSRFQLVAQRMRPLQRVDEMGLAWREAQASLGDLQELMQTPSQWQQRLPVLIDRLSEQMHRFQSNWDELQTTRTVLRDLDDVAYDFDSVVGGIHEAVLHLRMVPLDSVFRRLQRVARDTAEALDKPIDFAVAGGDTQIDKRVADELINPIVHMLRNSIDHGIEPKQARVDAGKPERGRIRINSFQRGSSVIIEIQDDGGGIDPLRMIKKVVDIGLKTQEEAEAMSAREAQRLIFTPGFSTAAKITEVSGRGVGLDIVAATIKSLRGSIDLESEPGVGTKFTIQLPPSMSILASLLIEVGDTMFGLPLTEVREIIELNKSRVRTVESRPMVVVRDKPMPLVQLTETYRFADSIATGASNVDTQQAIVFGHAGNEVALGVDRLVGKEDLVIKPLCSELAAVPGLAGMSIRGDGKVTLILDPSGFADFAMVRQRMLYSRDSGRKPTVGAL